ncbi:MAG: hypothetical protein PHW12_06005, partial [Smithella sp.]|nr:hypothetical protein [Smithella sp.]
MGAHKGIGDRLGIWEKGTCPHCGGQVSQPLALEFKRPKGKMSPDQIKFRQEWESRGGLFIPVWKVEDLAEGLGIKTLLT